MGTVGSVVAAAGTDTAAVVVAAAESIPSLHTPEAAAAGASDPHILDWPHCHTVGCIRYHHTPHPELAAAGSTAAVGVGREHSHHCETDPQLRYETHPIPGEQLSLPTALPQQT